ncbi:hyphally regulated cell wall protein 3-like [Micropterus salmoides]|uniref:hyphally regulated cell wall protein 3-like n=1 Tax=Micropterus salmoides TaxID=27706 RepID=UPI0018EA99D6|nr:hyphally regulated cell wall protein 3-like [Micropterus salmoides]
MACLCWMAVTLGLLLSAENSLAADVDQNQLVGIVNEILNRYRPSYNYSQNKTREPMFSLAVSIPYNSDRKIYDISQVTDTREQVWQSILTECEVYTSKRMVAATVLRWPNVVDQCPDGRVQWSDLPTKCGQTWADVKKQCRNVSNGRADHAEYRILQNFTTLVSNHDKNDLLLFYVLASPCDQRCTNKSHPYNILNSIKMIQQWNNYAVVFSKVFKPRGKDSIPEQHLRGSLERLGQSVGLINIFRCNRNECTSCSSGKQVTPYCYSDKAQPTDTKTDVFSSQSGLYSNHGNDSSNTGESVSPSPAGLNNDNGNKLNVAEDVSSSQSGLGSNNGNDGSNTGESVYPSQMSPNYDNGNNLNVGESLYSSQSGLDSNNGNDGSNTEESVYQTQMSPNYGNRNHFNEGGASSSQSGLDSNNGNDGSNTGEIVSPSQTGPNYDNGNSDFKTVSSNLSGDGIGRRKSPRKRTGTEEEKEKELATHKGRKGRGSSKPQGGKGKGISKHKGGKDTGISKRKGGKGTGISKRKGGKGKGMSKRKGGKGKDMSKRKGGKGRGISKRKGGKGKGISERKGGKWKDMSKRKGGKGRGISERKGGKGKDMSKRKGGKGIGISKRKGGKGIGISKRKGGKGTGISKRKGGKGSS